MQEKNINNASKMLFFRTILCFGENSGQTTVTGIAKKLNVEKYQISRIISSLEEQGIVEKDARGVPSLTKQGRQFIKKYHDRVELLVSFLLRAKLDPVYARDIALHIAGNANDEIMSIIETHEIRLKNKEALAKKIRFSGSQFTKSIKAGSYELSSVLVFNTDNELFSFVNQDKPSRLLLNISNKRGTLQFFPENDRIKDISYFDSGEYIQAEKVGDMFFIPADSLSFSQLGKTTFYETGFLGLINVKVKTVEMEEIVERQGVIEIIF